jgi:hypothetical protein
MWESNLVKCVLGTLGIRGGPINSGRAFAKEEEMRKNTVSGQLLEPELDKKIGKPRSGPRPIKEECLEVYITSLY